MPCRRIAFRQRALLPPRQRRHSLRLRGLPRHVHHIARRIERKALALCAIRRIRRLHQPSDRVVPVRSDALALCPVSVSTFPLTTARLPSFISATCAVRMINAVGIAVIASIDQIQSTNVIVVVPSHFRWTASKVLQILRSNRAGPGDAKECFSGTPRPCSSFRSTPY